MERFLSTTRPTGLNTSPIWNPYPGLEIPNDETSNNVEPIPVVELAPTSKVINKFDPVSVVLPIPLLETPITGRFSYDGDEIWIVGFVYPVPPYTTLKVRVPPAPTVAVMVAPYPI